jgi:thioredoxin-like negative regulator of GroEL
MTNITEKNFGTFILKGSTFLFLYSPRVLNSLFIEKDLKDLEKIYTQFNFGRVNIDQERALAIKLQLTVVPAFYLFKNNGILVDSRSGVLQRSQLEAFIKGHI